jgi:hypothetical protein
MVNPQQNGEQGALPEAFLQRINNIGNPPNVVIPNGRRISHANTYSGAYVHAVKLGYQALDVEEGFIFPGVPLSAADAYAMTFASVMLRLLDPVVAHAVATVNATFHDHVAEHDNHYADFKILVQNKLELADPIPDE